MLRKINILSWVPKLMCGGVGVWQSASTVSKGKMRGLRVQGTLKIKFGHYCDAFNLYIKYQLGTWWTDSHVWKIKNLQETPAPFVVCRFFASAIMKVTENLIYVSEIVSSNFLFCQNFVSPSCSLSLLNLLLTCFAVKPNQPVCWFHEEVCSLQLCWGRTVAVSPALHQSRRRQLFFPWVLPLSLAWLSVAVLFGKPCVQITWPECSFYCFINIFKL